MSRMTGYRWRVRFPPAMGAAVEAGRLNVLAPLEALSRPERFFELGIPEVVVGVGWQWWTVVIASPAGAHEVAVLAASPQRAIVVARVVAAIRLGMPR